MDWTLLIAYMTPIITALGTGIAFLVKIKQAFDSGAEHLKISQDDVKNCCKELLQENDIQQLNLSNSHKKMLRLKSNSMKCLLICRR